MLAALTWLMGLAAPLFSIFGIEISWRDIILIGGGMFLIAKATHEIHREVEARERPVDASGTTRSFAWIVVQLVAVDLVFSLDSILTAIGMAEHLEVMIAAVVIAMVVMYAAANPVGAFPPPSGQCAITLFSLASISTTSSLSSTFTYTCPFSSDCPYSSVPPIRRDHFPAIFSANQLSRVHGRRSRRSSSPQPVLRYDDG